LDSIARLYIKRIDIGHPKRLQSTYRFAMFSSQNRQERAFCRESAAFEGRNHHLHRKLMPGILRNDHRRKSQHASNRYASSNASQARLANRARQADRPRVRRKSIQKAVFFIQEQQCLDDDLADPPGADGRSPVRARRDAQRHGAPTRNPISPSGMARSGRPGCETLGSCRIPAIRALTL
jgi:hypothetical protein